MNSDLVTEREELAPVDAKHQQDALQQDVPGEETPPPEPKSRLRRHGVAIVLGIVVVFVGGLLAMMLVKNPTKTLCDDTAPDMALNLFQGYKGGVAGDTLTLADLKGKGVVINFWASWCQPCEQEAADLQAAYQKYKDKGIVFVGVDYYDQEPSALKYLQKFNITYPNGPDFGGAISKRYIIRGVPETFFVNPEGKLVGCRQVGPIAAPDLEARLAEIMPK